MAQIPSTCSTSACAACIAQCEPSRCAQASAVPLRQQHKLRTVARSHTYTHRGVLLSGVPGAAGVGQVFHYGATVRLHA